MDIRWISDGVNYLLAALKWYESEKFSLDNDKTHFGCSLDGIFAFKIVNRSIHPESSSLLWNKEKPGLKASTSIQIKKQHLKFTENFQVRSVKLLVATKGLLIQVTIIKFKPIQL